MENVNIIKMCFVILFIFMCNRTVAHNLDEGILIDTDADRFPIAKEYFVRTDDKDVNLYVREVGQGKPVIVLHGGFGNDHINVIKIANGLEKNFRFILYNQRCSTLSYCEKENILVENHLKDLETIKRKLKLDNFTLVSIPWEQF